MKSVLSWLIGLLIVHFGLCEQTSRYHRYFVSPDCDVMSSTFVPYSGIRIHLDRRYDIYTREFSSRLMRASLCLHGAEYSYSQVEFQQATSGSEWVEWSSLFCFDGMQVPDSYRGCYRILKTDPLPTTLNLLTPDRPMGLIVKCLDEECFDYTPFNTLLTDEPYKTWHEDLDLPLNVLAIRIPLMYTAEVFSPEHLHNTEVPLLCTNREQYEVDQLKYFKLVNAISSRYDALMRRWYGLQYSAASDTASALESLNERLLALFMRKNKRVVRMIVERLGRRVMKYYR